MMCHIPVWEPLREPEPDLAHGARPPPAAAAPPALRPRLPPAGDQLQAGAGVPRQEPAPLHQQQHGEAGHDIYTGTISDIAIKICQ